MKTNNIKRTIQAVALKATSYECMSFVYYYICLRKRLNLKEPQTFNEKLQWLKLNYWPYDTLAVQCANKYRVREYIESQGRGEILNTLYGVWDNAKDIDWDALPSSFVLKCNHGCGYNIFCKDKSSFDIQAATAQLNNWLREEYSLFKAEPHYAKIPHKIIGEAYLGDLVTNYNIYCLNGVPRFFSLATGLADGLEERLTYYYIDGRKAEFSNRFFQTDDSVELPPNLEEMVQIARALSKAFPAVRVDLYNIDGRIVFSELTFTPGSCFIPFEPAASDAMIGEWLDINAVMTKKGTLE